MIEEGRKQRKKSGLRDLCSGSKSGRAAGCRCVKGRGVHGWGKRHTHEREQLIVNHPATSDKQLSFQSLAVAGGRRNRFSEAYRMIRKAGLGDLL